MLYHISSSCGRYVSVIEGRRRRQKGDDRMKKTRIGGAATALLVSLALVLSGCKSGTDTPQETVFGQITALSSDSMTLALAQQNAEGQDASGEEAQSGEAQGESAPAQPQDKDAPQGQPQDAQDGQKNDAPQGQPEGAQDGQKNGSPQGQPGGVQDGQEKAQGDAPHPPEGDQGAEAPGNPPEKGGLALTGETKIIKIADSTEIWVLAADGTKAAATLSDLAVKDVVTVTVQDGTAVSVTLQSSMPQGAPGGNAAASGTAATSYDSDTSLSGESYSSEKSDENAVHAENGANVTLKDVSVTKSGDTSSADSSNFYGVNAGVLAQDGATLSLDGATVDTDASGANGVFAYGTGTVNVSGTTIRTKKDNSGGIEVAGGGSLRAENLDVETQGNSSAAIRSDRGGGTETVEGGTYVTNGTGSPAVYSTADVSVSNAALTANHSEAVVVEGKNSVALKNCTVSGSMDGTYGTDTENIHGVMIYQSMSGDAEEGEASFSMQGGSLTAKTGDLFYVTNTSCTITLEDAALSYDTTCSLLNVAGNDGSHGWGKQGANGGTVAMNCTAQTLAGDIRVDAVSKLALTLSGKSSFTGSINSENSGAQQAGVTIDDTSTWTLTDDCYLTEFTGSLSCVNANGHHLYVAGTEVL
jgi:hypothetical protein